MHNSAGILLARLLDDECEALKAGNWTALAPIATEKSKLLIDLQERNGRSSHLATIRAKAARNETLLAAAISGVKVARRRISELQDVRSDLRVYGKDGTLQSSKRQITVMERKA